MSKKKIIIVFEDHRDGIESLSFNWLLQQLNQQAIKVTDLVLENTKSETLESLLTKHQAILNNPVTRSEYMMGQYKTLLQAKSDGVKFHAADVSEKMFNKYLKDNQVIIQDMIKTFNDFAIKELGPVGIQQLRQSNPRVSDINMLINGFIQHNSASLWDNFSNTDAFKEHINKDIAHPMISKRDVNFAENINKIAKSAEGVVLVQLGSRHANVINLLKDKGYVNIIPLLIDLKTKDFDGMLLKHHLKSINFPSKFIISSKSKTVEQLGNKMMAKIKSLAIENLKNLVNIDLNSSGDFKIPALEVSSEWYSEDTITTLLQNLLPDQSRYYISPQTQFEHNDLLSANLAQAISNVIDGRIAVMPVNIHNNHWISIVIMQQRDGAIQVIINDPMGNSIENEPNTLLLVQTITDLVHNFVTDRILNIIDLALQQQAPDNYIDCGPITVENLRILAQAANTLDNLTRDQIIEAAGLESVSGQEVRTNHNMILGNSLANNVPESENSAEIAEEFTALGYKHETNETDTAIDLMPNNLSIAGLLCLLKFSGTEPNESI